jgi:hypothetical protein
MWDTFVSMSWFIFSKTSFSMIPVILLGLTVVYLIPSSKDLVFNVTKETFVFIFKGVYNVSIYPIVYAFNSVTGMIYVGRVPGPVNVPQANAPQANVPQANVPQANVPQANVPQANVPVNAPQANALSNAIANALVNALVNAPPANNALVPAPAPAPAMDQVLLNAILLALRNNPNPNPIIPIPNHIPNRNANENAIVVV